MHGLRAGVGWDLGGTKLDGVWVDSRGRIQGSETQELPPDRSLGGLGAFLEALDAKLVGSRLPPRVSGLSVAAVVEGPEAKATHAPNLPALRGRALVPWLERRLGRRFVVVNDANAGAEVERRLGRVTGDFLYVILGTGIGGAWVLDGRVYPGRYGSAGEIGHVYAGPPDRPCGCGLRGCLETQAGGRWLGEIATEGLGPRRSRAGGRVDRPWTAKELLLLAEEGHPRARVLRDRAGGVLGRALASLMNATGVERVVIDGRLLVGAPGYARTIRKAWSEGLIAPLKGRARWTRARPFPHRMAYGAWSLAQPDAPRPAGSPG